MELDPKVLTSPKFRERNPHYRDGQPCFYVGMTSLDPKERFAQHKAGKKAAGFVKRYGQHLRKRMYNRYNPMSYYEASARERQLASDLRKRGFGVWQN